MTLTDTLESSSETWSSSDWWGIYPKVPITRLHNDPLSRYTICYHIMRRFSLLLTCREGKLLEIDSLGLLVTVQWIRCWHTNLRQFENWILWWEFLIDSVICSEIGVSTVRILKKYHTLWAFSAFLALVIDLTSPNIVSENLILYFIYCFEFSIRLTRLTHVIFS